VIAITFLGATVSAAILPWRKREIYSTSPIAKYKVLGLPLITFAAIMFGVILLFALVKWFTDRVYGVNHTSSLIYMVACTCWRSRSTPSRASCAVSRGMDLGLV
jgi:hypothetical protein